MNTILQTSLSEEFFESISVILGDSGIFEHNLFDLSLFLVRREILDRIIENSFEVEII
jgi:hypothetical protein